MDVMHSPPLIAYRDRNNLVAVVCEVQLLSSCQDTSCFYYSYKETEITGPICINHILKLWLENESGRMEQENEMIIF
jgi:hypothetical protein